MILNKVACTRRKAGGCFYDGEENEIKKIGGKEETRRHLENLGFVVGGKVAVISETDGNMIVNVKEARVAIGKDMANKIMI